MTSAGSGLTCSFQSASQGGGPRSVALGTPRRRPRRSAGGLLPVLALIAWGLGMVVLTQWLHPAGPIEDPLITQQQLDF